MKASIVDLRYRMRDVIRALRRREEVHILYHGKNAGTIIPAKARREIEITAHPFFGLSRGGTSRQAVEKEVDRLRSLRYRAL